MLEFEERLRALALKVSTQSEAIQTEEATKNAFIMPFISTVLGYDVFNPLEVVPEFISDVGLKKGEKVDYAIVKDGEVQILIECKSSKEPLKIEYASQLFRYFHVTNARIAILTNGSVYNFYTDLEAPNKMDERPFLVLDLHDIDETLIPELRKLTKDSFDLESVISAAEELKYVGSLKREIARQFREPDEDFVRLLASHVYEGRITRDVREQFDGLARKALKQFLNEQVNGRLKTALGAGESTAMVSYSSSNGNESEAVAEQNLEADPEIETTLEELEGYQIVKAIACAEVRPERITHRDAKTYFAIFIDDNNRKPVARLHFNGKSKKYLGLFDENKNETRHEINSLEEIYMHADEIREAVKRFA